MTQEPLELAKGMIVQVSTPDDPRGEEVEAQVLLVSPNGQSVAMMMEGGLRVPGGLIIGPLLLSRMDDGTYHELVTSAKITVKLS